MFKSAGMIKKYQPAYKKEVKKELINILMNVEPVGSFIEKKEYMDIHKKNKNKSKKETNHVDVTVESIIKPILDEAWDIDSENGQSENENNTPGLYH